MQYLYQYQPLKTPISFYILLIISAAASFTIFHFDYYYSLAVIIFIHQFLSLYFKLGKAIPIRNLIGTMFSLNYLFSPVLMFSWLDAYVDYDEFQMRGDPETYFAYAIPAILLLIIGLYVFAGKHDEKLNTEKISEIIKDNPKLPFQLIMIGIISDVLRSFTPSELDYVMNNLGYLKVVGFLLSLFSGKFNVVLFILSYGILIVRSLTSSMFNDLLNMLFFLAFIICYRYKPSHVFKIAGVIAGVMFIVFIQNIKFVLRAQVTNSVSDLSKLNNVIEETKEENAASTKEEKVIKIVTRINQGWFTSSTMNYYNNGGFELEEGKHSLIILQTSVLPRILAPNRYNVGDRTLFNKYSGHFIDAGTSMALGILTDGFIDYGSRGVIVVFAFGLILGVFIRIYKKMDDKYPLALICSPICFFAVRPDTDTYGALGALIKTTFILWGFLYCLNKYYLKSSNKLVT
ncbi:MAG: hypothetical protein M3342_23735 [Bacteroidota bacterium]|nr:hypothetical protein [Bacteroidota bacterium]